MKYCIILVLTTAIFWACSGPDHNHHLATELDSAHQNQESDDGHDHTQLAHAPDDGHGDNQDTHRISMTQFSCNYEMFLEYSVKEKDKTAGFLFHITKLDDCSPFNDRDIEFQILADDGRVIASPHLHPEQPGILSAEQVMDTPGNLTGRLTIGTEKAEIFNFDLYRPDHIKTHENGEQNGILFTKEKQWITDFMVRPIERKTMHASVTAVADVLPRQDGYAQVVVPIAGILNPMHNPLVTMVGRQVQSGDVLAVLCPPLTGLSSWTSRQMAYEQAKSEYERAVRLYEKDAISKREMERLEREYLVQKDGFDFYLERQGTPQQKENDNNRNHFFVKAPIRGIITEVHAVMGQTLTVGDKMYTIVDPSAVWLKVNLHERDYYKLDRQIFGATVFLAGRDPLILEKK
ncbi:efflux RND transporter periplasmic adaptor subunit, partial [candidate division KSB1 bacterium]|nr:efflux RND transporter periplasmic adaptor subunit [candidate division KSB1 bacterium]